LPLIVAQSIGLRMDLAAEPQQNTASPALQPKAARPKRWGIPFTQQTAAEMARRSQAARKQRELDRKAELNRGSAITSADDAQYRQFRLTRTREQLLQLDRDLEAAKDERGKKAICDAIARLSEVEQKLAMRPGPGNVQPSKRQSQPTITIAEPL